MKVGTITKVGTPCYSRYEHEHLDLCVVDEEGVVNKKKVLLELGRFRSYFLFSSFARKRRTDTRGISDTSGYSGYRALLAGDKRQSYAEDLA